MKELAKQISSLLFEHDCVIVPGLGGFIANYKPAAIHPQHNTFYPPSKRISFNTALNINDGLLINAWAVNNGIDFNSAVKQIESKVDSIRFELLRGNKVILDDLGYFIANKENNIQFHFSSSINYLAEAYGFTKFEFSPVQSPSSDTVIGIDKQTVRKTMKWAAIIAPILAVAMFTTLNENLPEKLKSNYASLFPSTHEVSVSNEKKDVIKTPVLKTIIADTLIEQPAQASTGISAPVSSVDTESAVYHIVVGAFSIEENAVKFTDQLTSKGYKATLLGQNRRKLHMVSIESCLDKDTANNKLIELQQSGYPAAWIFEQEK